MSRISLVGQDSWLSPGRHGFDSRMRYEIFFSPLHKFFTVTHVCHACLLRITATRKFLLAWNYRRRKFYARIYFYCHAWIFKTAAHENIFCKRSVFMPLQSGYFSTDASIRETILAVVKYCHASHQMCRYSSAGRASDWRSEGPRFDPGWRHECNYFFVPHTFRSVCKIGVSLWRNG